MRYCKTCLSPLESGSSCCPNCGARVYDIENKISTVTLRLTAKEARRGCQRLVNYSAAPSALRVELPAGLEDGEELYISRARFLLPGGGEELGPLRIIVRVEHSRLPLGAAALASTFLLALCFIGLYLLLQFRQVEIVSPPATPSAPVSVQTQVVQEPVPTIPPSQTPQLSAMQRQAAALIPHFQLRYYLMALDDRLLDNFCALYGAVQDFQASCSFPCQLSKEELTELMLLLSYECPELLQFSSVSEVSFFSDMNGNVVSVTIPYSMGQEEYQRQYAACQSAAEELAVRCLGLDEMHRELAAYDFLKERCFYDYDAPWSFSAYGALVDGRAKCDGISLAMKWLCEEMGIPCAVLAGNTGEGSIGHAWNLICVDGTWYDLDVTNDVMSDSRSDPYYGAFNVSRHWIRDKYPENLSFSGFIILPGSESMGMSFHALNGSLVYAGGDAEEMLFRQLDALDNGQAAFLQFEDGEEYRAFVADINTVMSRWGGISKGSFNFSLSHLDEFQVCRISVTYI